VSHRVLLAGLGAIGMSYDIGHAADHVRTHARALSRSPGFGPMVGVDPDPARRSLFEATYKAECFESLADALAVHEPDVVVIATPTVNHAEALRVVLERSRPRAILCEKPLAYELETAHSMVAACERAGVQLYVNYMRRSDPAVHAVRRMIDDGIILTPLKAVVWYSKGLIHNGSHLVNLMGFWLGAPRQAALIRAGRRWQQHDPEPDFVLEYPRGRATFLAANEEHFSHYTVELVAQNGRLRYERGGELVEWHGVVDDEECAGYRILAAGAERLHSGMRTSQLNVTSELAAALRGEPASVCTGRDALETLRDIYRVIDLL
jgi:predicted dehydrogenase